MGKVAMRFGVLVQNTPRMLYDPLTVFTFPSNNEISHLFTMHPVTSSVTVKVRIYFYSRQMTFAVRLWRI
jgi:hypothetical protein